MLLCANSNICRIEELKRLGYDAIDVGFTRVIYNNDPYPHDPILDNDNWQADLDPYIEKCKEIGLKISSTHLPYRYDHTDPKGDKFDFFHGMAIRSLQASEYLGAKWTVMHLINVNGTVEYAKKLFADSGVKKIGIAIENDPRLSLDELIEAHDTLKNEGYNVGICLDVGHCHINTKHENNVPDVIRQMGERIKVLHIHDNCRNLDMHKAPFTGTMDWNGVMCALKDIKFTGEFNFELQPERIPEPARLAYEKYCVDIGRYLISLYDKE